MTTNIARTIERRERDLTTRDLTTRDKATGEQISRVIGRWHDKPSPFRSRAEYLRALADAYQARTELWQAATEYAITHHSGMWASYLLFHAIQDARNGCAEQAWELREQAASAARWEQEQAFVTYADNIGVAHTGAVVTRSAVAA